MGINGLLPRILPSAGRENYDLRALADGIIALAPPVHDDSQTTTDDPAPAPKRRRWTRRRVRIAVDVNGWIARAAHGFGGSLMDERHLTYHGRAQLRSEQQQQQQQQAEDGGEESDEREEGDEEQPNENQATNEEQIQQQQRTEYISQCNSFVLHKIEYLRDQCQALVLPVLDGATPPCKREAVRGRSDKRKRATRERDGAATSPQRPAAPTGEEEGDEGEQGEAARTEAEVLKRISASRRAGTGKDYALRREMLGELLKEFRKRQWPFVVAPYEADGQLAYLANTGGVDVVVTEDSDLIAYGVPTLVYKLGGWNGANAANRAGVGTNVQGVVSGGRQTLRGTLLHRKDLGAAHGIDLMDFSDAMLATTFVAAGCDYCSSLTGIGVVTARNIVQRAFRGGKDGGAPVLRKVLDELFRKCGREARLQLLPLDDPGKEEVRAAYERSFLAALAMFRHPIVYDPISKVHAVANDVCDDGAGGTTSASASFRKEENVLMEYAPYKELVTNRERLYDVIGTPFAPEVAKGITEGLIDPRNPNLLESNSNSQHTEEDGTEYRDLTEGSSGLQLSSQAGTQQSKSSSAASGFISSLSPDLLASPSPQKPA